MQRLGMILKRARGGESRVQFARRLGLSYTFVRAMEQGQRFPSDKVLLEIAERLDLDQGEFLLAAWTDRSPELGRVLRDLGVELPDEVEHDDEGDDGEIVAKGSVAREERANGSSKAHRSAG